jgi:hypothetical protein
MHTGLPMDNKQLVGVVSDAAGGWSSEAARGGGGAAHRLMLGGSREHFAGPPGEQSQGCAITRFTLQ